MPKIIHADAKGRTDGSANKLAELVLKHAPTSFPDIVLVTSVDGYVFNEELSTHDRPYILFDFVEYGWDWDYTPHLFNNNYIGTIPRFSSPDWDCFHAFVSLHPPLTYFKRELLQTLYDKQQTTQTTPSGFLKPINYPCWHTVPLTQSQSQFDTRPLDVFYAWGRSHEDRLRLQGEIWQRASALGYNVCDNLFTINEFIQHEASPRWVATNIPHYARQDMSTIMQIQGHSRISVSKSGAGVTCFRHTESPVNAVMLMTDSPIMWSYRWVHGYNCLCATEGKEVDMLHTFTSRDPEMRGVLYDIYTRGVEMCRKYEVDTYIRDYIKPNIPVL